MDWQAGFGSLVLETTEGGLGLTPALLSTGSAKRRSFGSQVNPLGRRKSIKEESGARAPLGKRIGRQRGRIGRA